MVLLAASMLAAAAGFLAAATHAQHILLEDAMAETRGHF